MKQANILAVGCVGFLVGVAVASFIAPPIFLLLGIAALAPCFFVAFFHIRLIHLAAAAGLFFMLGMLLFQYTAERAFPTAAAGVEGTHTLEGVVVEHPDARPEKTFLIVEPLGSASALGIIRVTTDAGVPYKAGEHLRIEGVVEVPQNFDDFDYQGYLAKEGISYIMQRPNITQTGVYEHGITYALSSARERLEEGLNTTLLPPHSSLYSAMILGSGGMLSAGDRQALQRAGLSHIVAISGMHIVILLFMVLYAGIAAGLWRSQASYVALVFIAAYILMIGAPASAVRAGFMGAALVLSERTGRPRSSWRILLVVAAGMVAVNPLIMRYDVGFQLSFLAVAGILLLAPRFEHWLSRVPDTGGVRSTLGMTLSAQVFTAPVAWYHFGSISFVAPLTNILVLPMVPAVLVAGFAAAAGGAAGGIISAIAAAPAWAFSAYIWGVVALFG
jgi:competence protein ComEC